MTTENVEGIVERLRKLAEQQRREGHPGHHAPYGEEKVTVELTRKQAGEVAVAAHTSAAEAFAANQWQRAARYYRTAAELCEALKGDT